MAATPELTRAALAGPGELAASLGAVVPSSWPPMYLDPPSLEYTLDRLGEGPDQAGWWLYFVVLIGEAGRRTLVGSGGYKGPPESDGTVEIGYGIVGEHQRRGYATKTVHALLERAFALPAVSRAIAETLPELAPSIGVLRKCGFRLIGEGGEPGVIRFELTRAEWLGARSAETTANSPIGMILASLTSFYDFAGKVVVHVGAGGGQLIGYAPVAKRVIAVDNDPAAILRLRSKIAEQSLEAIVSVVTGDFCRLDLLGDVVLFEFCLHEMPEPATALAHARRVAREVVVLDHRPESRWIWYANEDQIAARAWAAIDEIGATRRQSYQAFPRFKDYSELQAKLSAQGDESLRRIQSLQGRTEFEIPMPYGILLLNPP